MKRLAMMTMAAALFATPVLADNTGPSIADMAQQLGLDKNQTQEFTTILQEQRVTYRQRQQGLRDRGVERGSDEAKKEVLSGRSDTLARLGTVLSPDQLKQFQQIQGETAKGTHLRRHNRAVDRDARLSERQAQLENRDLEASEVITEKAEAREGDMRSRHEERRQRREERRLKRDAP